MTTKELAPPPALILALMTAKTRMRYWRNMLRWSNQTQNPNGPQRFRKANLPGDCNKVTKAYAKLKVATSKLANHIIIEGSGLWNRLSSSTMKDNEGSWRGKVKKPSEDQGRPSFEGGRAPTLMVAMVQAHRQTEALI